METQPIMDAINGWEHYDEYWEQEGKQQFERYKPKKVEAGKKVFLLGHTNTV
ncbi:MAG: hypothetical protein ACQESX_01560 [Bacteroidota bacterium]